MPFIPETDPRTLVRESRITAMDGAFCGFGHWVGGVVDLLSYRFEVEGVTFSGMACYEHTEDEWGEFIAKNRDAIRNTA